MTGSGPLRVAMIGTGWAARSIWLPRLAAHPRLVLAAAVDPDPAARVAADAPMGFATVAELPPGTVDLAVVAVPNHLHAAVAEELLTAGIPTFVEKPVCLTSADADRLATAERAGGAVLLAGSAARYRTDVRTLLELAGTVGDIRHIALSWVRAKGIPSGVGWFTRRGLSGGGALVDLGWHLLDTILPLIGKDTVEQVAGSVSADFIHRGSARAAWRHDATGDTTGDVEDTARGFLVMRDGLSVSLTTSWASHQPVDKTTITVEGSAGTVSLTCTFGFSPNRVPSTLTVTRAGTTEEVPAQDPVGAEYDRQLDDLPARWADPVSHGVAIDEARRVVDVIERVYRFALPKLAVPDPVPDPVRAVVFDLDGVLVNSFGVMRQAFDEAYREVVGDGEPPFEEYNRHLGRYFPEIMRIMGLPLEMEEPFVLASTRLADQVTMYDGVRELLHLLREYGIGTAVATGKAGWRARFLLDRLGVLPFFDHIIGSDEVEHAKPAPDIVRRALDLLHVDSIEAVMIGDAVTDLAAAKAAGVTAIAALWGETDEKSLLAAGPDLVLRDPADLIRLCWPSRSKFGARGLLPSSTG